MEVNLRSREAMSGCSWVGSKGRFWEVVAGEVVSSSFVNVTEWREAMEWVKMYRLNWARDAWFGLLAGAPTRVMGYWLLGKLDGRYRIV